MRKKIIFIHFNRFLNEFDWERYEFNKLSKKFDIKVHVLINLVHPYIKNNIYDNSKFSKKFDDIDKWKKEINSLDKNSFFIFQSFPYNFTALKLYYFIKLKGFKTSIILINNLPKFKDKGLGYKLNFLDLITRKIKSVIFRPHQALGQIKKKIISFLFFIKPKTFEPDIYFQGGAEKKKNKFSKNIAINSWDYSNFLRKKNKNFKLKKDYILYLSDGENRYQTDSHLYNAKSTVDKKAYIKLLNDFFYQIEKKYKTKVVIASHPRGNPKLNFDKDFKNRRIFYNKTSELSARAKLIISTGSTALAYAILCKKPILFIYSDSQHKKNISFMKFQNFYANILRRPRLDIDNFKDLSNYIDNKIDKEAYEKYEKKYIIRKKFKVNYQIFKYNIEKMF